MKILPQLNREKIGCYVVVKNDKQGKSHGFGILWFRPGAKLLPKWFYKDLRKAYGHVGLNRFMIVWQ